MVFSEKEIGVNVLFNSPSRQLSAQYDVPADLLRRSHGCVLA